MNSTITATLVFKGQSMNYGEASNNFLVLKKFNRGDGTQETTMSRQAIRHSTVTQGEKMFGWKLQNVDKSKGTVQFIEGSSIKDSIEMDLFGYMMTKRKDATKQNNINEGADTKSTPMMTEKKDETKQNNIPKGADTRSAPIRISFATSLEPYKNDVEFLSNKGFADRVDENANIVNIEQHMSFYTYTITIDLARIGEDKEIKIDKKIRLERLSQFLDVIKTLSRDIRGRTENLSPLFVIGGMYKTPNPVFLGRMQLFSVRNKFAIDLEPLKSAMEISILGNSIKEETFCGIINGIFANEKEIKEVFSEKLMSVNAFFEKMKDNIKKYYGLCEPNDEPKT